MVKIQPLFSITPPAGWLGGKMYSKRQYRNGVWVPPKRVVPIPYPIGLMPFIRLPYKVPGTSLKDHKLFYAGRYRHPYHIPAFGLFPYPPFISQYYSATGWIYQARRTWHGVIAIAKRASLPPEPGTPYQVGNWAAFAEAVKIWQSMEKEVKDLYNKMKYPEKASGYNRFISWYLRTHPYMPIYWGTLQRSANDPSKIEDAFVLKNNPQITYPFQFYHKQAFNFVLHKGSGFPENPVEGQLFYREDEKKIYRFDGSAWGEVGGSSPSTDKTVATVIVAADGSGDYTDIQQAINALPNFGGLVFIKNGTYNISNSIVINKSNVTLQGAGFSTVIRLNNNVNDDVIKVGDGSNSYSKIVLRDFKVDGNKDNNSYAVNIYVQKNCSDITITGVWSYNSSGPGILIDTGAHHCKIFGCIIEKTASSGISCFSANHLTVQGCKFLNTALNFGSGIQIDSAIEFLIIGNRLLWTQRVLNSNGIMTFGYMTNAKKGIIANNIIEGCDNGLNLSTNIGINERIIASSNYIKDVYNIGISVASRNSNIVGNIIQGADGDGIRILDNGVVVSSNQISNVGKNGIVCYSSDVIIQANFLEKIQLYGIFLGSTENVLVSGNRIYDCSLALDGFCSAIFCHGSSGALCKNNSIYDNVIIGPTSGNRKGYSIREYGNFVDYNMIRGNRCRHAKFFEILLLGRNSEAFDNTVISS